mmetsp:Transcript_15639/g.11376  ORF Transcript_15639/g.11376 Transcript_15639/m.11376 type:complete len:122 (-) Transcript_15639:77-442(-)
MVNGSFFSSVLRSIAQPQQQKSSKWREQMEGVDFAPSEGFQHLRQRQAAIPFFRSLPQSDSMEPPASYSMEAQEASNKFGVGAMPHAPAEIMSDLNEEEKSRKQRQEKCFRRSCSSVKGKP